MPLSTLQLTPRGVTRKTQGQDGVAFSFPVGILPPLQHAGLARRTPRHGFAPRGLTAIDGHWRATRPGCGHGRVDVTHFASAIPEPAAEAGSRSWSWRLGPRLPWDGVAFRKSLRMNALERPRVRLVVLALQARPARPWVRFVFLHSVGGRRGLGFVSQFWCVLEAQRLGSFGIFLRTSCARLGAGAQVTLHHQADFSAAGIAGPGSAAPM